MFSSFTVIGFSVGVSVTLTLGAVFPWRITIGITAIAPLITFLALLACPESPVWLLTQGKKLSSNLPNLIFNQPNPLGKCAERG